MKMMKQSKAAVVAIAATAACLMAATSLSPRIPDFAPQATDCRETTPRTDGVLRRFAGSDNDEIRRVPGLGTSTVAEARPLTAAQDAAACHFFNEKLSFYIRDTQSGGTPTYDVAYYKWRGYYVAALGLRLSDEPGVGIVGLDEVYVFDDQLGQVAGLAM